MQQLLAGISAYVAAILSAIAGRAALLYMKISLISIDELRIQPD